MLDSWKSGSFEITIKAKYAIKCADYAMIRKRTIGFVIINLHGFEIL